MPPKAPSKPATKAKPAAKHAAKSTAAKPKAKPATKAPAAAAAAAAPAPAPAPLPEPVFIEVEIKRFAAVLFDGVDTRVKDTGKWGVLVDTTNVVSTFIRHRDCNYLNAADPANMTPEAIRLAVMGSLRFGKVLVVDMLEMDMLEAMKSNFNGVEPNLWENILSKKILEEEHFKKLLKDSDDEMYNINNFAPMYLETFHFCVVTTMENPPLELLHTMCPVRVVKA